MTRELILLESTRCRDCGDPIRRLSRAVLAQRRCYHPACWERVRRAKR